jgi:4-amino-4-deoxy-L-arabinose transferase-like glycosyltransferase
MTSLAAHGFEFDTKTRMTTMPSGSDGFGEVVPQQTQPGVGVIALTGGAGAWSRSRLEPQALVALILLSFGVVWLALLSYTSLSPPTDNIEQLTWVNSLEGGYYKQPPLPTWLLWLPVKLFGASAWTSYVAGAVCTLGAIALLWHLLSGMRGWRHATLALLAVLCITYYNGRLYYYNHEMVLMVLSAASAACCWKARVTGRTVWWAALGVALGLGALAKYQVAVTVACVLAFWLHQRGWRDPVQRRGLLLAFLLALLVFVPHIYWLRTHDFAPIHYAIESSIGAQLDLPTRVLASLHWLADQMLNRALPAWIVLGVVAFAWRRRDSQPRRWRSDALQPADAGRALLLSWGVVPLLFMPAVGLLVGADLPMHWGTPFLLFAVPAAMELSITRIAWQRVALRPAVAAFSAMQIFLLLLNYATSPTGLAALQRDRWLGFDSAALARALEQPARAALGGKIHIISGPAAIAGALALTLTDQPKVLIDGRMDRSPWIRPERIRQCGALELGSAGSLPGGLPVGPSFPGLVWHVKEPQPGASSCPG